MKLHPPFDVLSIPLVIVILLFVAITVFFGFNPELCLHKDGFIWNKAICFIENYPLQAFLIVAITSPFILKENFSALTKKGLDVQERKDALKSFLKGFTLLIIVFAVLFLISKFLL